MRLAVSLLCVCIAMIPQQSRGASERMSPQEIVNRVNNDPKSTWKADTYGMDKYSANQFARSHLGARLDLHNEGRRGAGPRERPVMNYPGGFQGMKKK